MVDQLLAFFHNSDVLWSHTNVSFDMCAIMCYVTVRVAPKMELLIQNKGFLTLLVNLLIRESI